MHLTNQFTIFALKARKNGMKSSRWRTEFVNHRSTSSHLRLKQAMISRWTHWDGPTFQRIPKAWSIPAIAGVSTLMAKDRNWLVVHWRMIFTWLNSSTVTGAASTPEAPNTLLMDKPSLENCILYTGTRPNTTRSKRQPVTLMVLLFLESSSRWVITAVQLKMVPSTGLAFDPLGGKTARRIGPSR